MHIVDVVLISIIGIIEGVTEWLPISSTGHMMIFEHFFAGAFTEGFFTSDFKNMFEYLIQLGAILAVVVVFWKRVFPFALEKREKIDENGQTLTKTSLRVSPKCGKPGSKFSLRVFRRSSRSLRISYSIISAKRGKSLWSGRCSRFTALRSSSSKDCIKTKSRKRIRSAR